MENPVEKSFRSLCHHMTYLVGATAAFFPAFPFPISMALVATALLWVKAFAEQAMETATTTANKVLLANMVKFEISQKVYE